MRVLILSDGKPGHVKQSQAVAVQIAGAQTQILSVEFKSSAHKILFPPFAFLVMPWANDGVRRISFFFKPGTQKLILNAAADFIISAGTDLAPLNLYLTKALGAKNVIVMKPSFPFNLFQYDLPIVPAHDRGLIPGNAFRPVLALSQMTLQKMAEDAAKLKAELRNPLRIRFSLFLGGPTRGFRMELGDIEKLFAVMGRVANEFGDYLVTTSRRTPDDISHFLKQNVRMQSGCQMVVIAAEDLRREVVSGLMGLAEILIVTEDSVSMISEAVASGKKVIVLHFSSDGLPAKHKRFKQILTEQSAITPATLENLEEKIKQIQTEAVSSIADQEIKILKQKLQEIL